MFWSEYIGLRPDGRVGEMLARLSVSFLLSVSFFYFEKSKKNVSFSISKIEKNQKKNKIFKELASTIV